MAKQRRVAIAIDLEWAFRHHVDVNAGIHRYAQTHGDWECFVSPFAENVIMAAKGHKRCYDGIIARATSRLASLAAAAGIPLVNVWAGCPAKGLPAVFPDFEKSGRMAGDYLLKRGYRNFAFLGHSGTQSTQLQMAGFQSVIAAAQCECATRLISTRYANTPRSWDHFAATMSEWIGQWKLPLAFFTSHDTNARYMAELCVRAGLRIPDDVAIVGVNNEPMLCIYPEPSLSSIDYGYEQIGYEAAALLNRLMDGARPPKEAVVIDRVQLIPRRSTDAYVVDDSLVVQALRFIGQHSHEAIRVDHVAANVATTRRSLERHFRATLDRTVEQEITRLRLERAKRLLVESDEPIKRLATTCGFTNTQHICRVFGKMVGLTPQEYRRRHRKEPTLGQGAHRAARSRKNLSKSPV